MILVQPRPPIQDALVQPYVVYHDLFNIHASSNENGHFKKCHYFGVYINTNYIYLMYTFEAS